MHISILQKKPEPPVASANAARTELKDRLRAIAALLQQRQAVADKDTAALSKLDGAKRAAAKVAEIRADIDRALADALYAEAEPPDLSTQRAALAEAERNSADRAADARAIEAVRGRYAADVTKLNDQLRALQEQTPRLVHAAAVEEMVALAPEFRAAEEALRAVHFKVFTRAALADQLAMSERMGVFQGVGLFGDLNVTRPNHEAFRRGSADAWTRQQEHNNECKAVDVAADQLHRSLLTGEA
jgi:hypothetical protein